ncbi:MAG: hypothetical protein CMH70_02770 [Nitrosomonadaceae bacterium]|nr:hypothetical protein [Nitrosomonadaceae bacterium]|tara:strand:- start:242 stop:517 length:276 start_codon:yes stop_codon:yes gene_type:complete
MTSPASTPSFISYPCEFPIKVMGKNEKGFTESILRIVNRHIPEFDDNSIEKKVSTKNKYLSLTCTVYVVSQHQLDSLYQELSDFPMALMVI